MLDNYSKFHTILIVLILFFLSGTVLFANDLDLDITEEEISVSSIERYVSGLILTDTVWSADNVYIMEGNILVTDGATLTIEPGTIIKFRDNIWLNVFEGNIVARGKEDAPIYLTSIHDDSVGGDSDGDGDARAPGHNDQWGVNIGYSDLSSFHLTNISYSYGGIFTFATNSDFKDVNIKESSSGIVAAHESNMIIENMRVHDMFGDAIVAYQISTITMINTHLRNIWNGDGIGAYDGSFVSLDNSSVRDIGSGSAIGLYGSASTISNSLFSGGLDSGIELYYSNGESNIELIGSTVEGYYNSGLISYKSISNVERSRFRNNGYSGASIFGDLQVHRFNRNAFYGNLEYALEALNNIQVEATNNWWGDSSGPFEEFENPSGLGDEIYGNVNFIPWLISDPTLVSDRNPVIIVPGIMGSELYNGEDLIWLNLKRMSTDIGDQFLTENLSLDEKGDSMQYIVLGDAIKRIKLGIFDRNILEALQQELELYQYQIENNLFFFSYDWRLDLNKTVDLLIQKIEQIKLETGSDKVDIIAHSMGGLLAKAVINSHIRENVDKLIFIGTPHLGAPKAGKILLEGDRFGIPWLDSDRIKEIGLNLPSLHQLLPVPKYFDEFQGYITKFKIAKEYSPLDFDSTTDFYIDVKDKNPIMFHLAENFHQFGLNFPNLNNMSIYNISGCRNSTQTSYSLNLFNEIRKIGYTSGDGTVPLISADYIDLPMGNKFYVRNGHHTELPSTNGVRKLIIDILNNEEPSLEKNISDDKSFCNFNGKSISWHSPVEVHIYDQNGNHTGPIDDGSIEYGITGIDYDIIDNEKFIFLPTDDNGEYFMEAVGQKDGSFDLKISDVNNGEVILTRVFNDVPISYLATVGLLISEFEQNDSISIKNDGEVFKFSTDAVLDGDEINDLFPPHTTAKIVSAWNRKTSGTNQLQLILDAEDLESGILATYYSLNNDSSFVKYENPIQINRRQGATIFYYSVDRAGNNEEVKIFDIKTGIIKER
jgi:hypothetical protein